MASIAPLSPFDAAGAKLTEALSCARSGDSFRAVALTVAALESCPADVTVQHRAGVIYRQCGDLMGAVEHFERALSLSPDFYFSTVEIAQIRHEQGDIAVSRTWWERAINTAPGYAVAYRQFAAMERMAGNPAVARGILRKGHEALPAEPDIAAELADIEIYHGNRQGAIQCFEIAFDAGVRRPDLHIKYLSALSELGQYRKLIAHRNAMDLAGAEPETYLADLLSGQAKLAESYNLAALVESARFRESTPRWHGTWDVHAAISAAIADRRPFSLIRMGDGEGRFLA